MTTISDKCCSEHDLWCNRPGGLPQTARGEFIVIATPTDAYTGETSKIAITGPVGTTYDSLSDGFETVTFSGEMSVAAVGPGIFGWGNPPTVEDSAPPVLFSEFALSRTFTFDHAVTTFGVEMQSNNPTNPLLHPTFTLTATFFDGDTQVGSISQRLRAPGGAHLFAATTTDSEFTRVVLTSSSGSGGFDVGQIRYTVVPEPASAVLLGLGGLGVLGFHVVQRQRRAPTNDR